MSGTIERFPTKKSPGGHIPCGKPAASPSARPMKIGTTRRSSFALGSNLTRGNFHIDVLLSVKLPQAFTQIVDVCLRRNSEVGFKLEEWCAAHRGRVGFRLH